MGYFAAFFAAGFFSAFSAVAFSALGAFSAFVAAGNNSGVLVTKIKYQLKIFLCLTRIHGLYHS